MRINGLILFRSESSPMINYNLRLALLDLGIRKKIVTFRDYIGDL